MPTINGEIVLGVMLLTEFDSTFQARLYNSASSYFRDDQ
jgi:hypothetical protein